MYITKYTYIYYIFILEYIYYIRAHTNSVLLVGAQVSLVLLEHNCTCKYYSYLQAPAGRRAATAHGHEHQAEHDQKWDTQDSELRHLFCAAAKSRAFRVVCNWKKRTKTAPTHDVS